MNVIYISVFFLPLLSSFLESLVTINVSNLNRSLDLMQCSYCLSCSHCWHFENLFLKLRTEYYSYHKIKWLWLLWLHYTFQINPVTPVMISAEKRVPPYVGNFCLCQHGQDKIFPREKKTNIFSSTVMDIRSFFPKSRQGFSSWRWYFWYVRFVNLLLVKLVRWQVTVTVC